ncbi:hypothetical protein [Methylobacterium iners]|uniref:Uncharacterized protein n=1 Tax=Methylobacterium iners TaxID=418707 RepID=A0ABQ4S2T9_9HYPH|nr:hypothetical protein [Methylobacterium iners]GJD97448.1 hypothetical protein OCOJLMKI_4679 [Methylobacterium iners]
MTLAFIALAALLLLALAFAAGSRPALGPVDRDAILADLIDDAFAAVEAGAATRPPFLPREAWRILTESHPTGERAMGDVA